MPFLSSPSPDYTVLRRCREQALATMTNWSGGQAKFDEVLNRRAWKLYRRCA